MILALAIAGAGRAESGNEAGVLLAKTWTADHDPAAYWVSEKYDGVRAIWDGRDFRFRSGRPIPAPRWFVAGLPPQALDGELWLCRGCFEEVSGIVRKAIPVDEEWRRVRYMIFEAPGAPGDFTARIETIRQIVESSLLPNLEAVSQFRVSDRKALVAKLNEVVKAGGEGLILHRAAAPYHGGRSDDLLKLKRFDDAEATVVGHIPGKGRLANMTGALQMETPDGRRFRIGSGLTDAVRRNPPPLGTVVTYRYSGLTTKGLPRFPRFWRVRDDP
ncbi:MAG: DNA ligase [Gammaproteobacteria bacterium]|nr:DNA ligase [Gammaproteobacteria bacterium]MBU1414849.1 DNA ligase [Gammaproteobacteria bacterium]